jgi:quercetin dioxygenase-like cupin family protein
MNMRSAFLRMLAGAVLVGAASASLSTGALAADCPAGKEGTDVTKPGPSKPVGVTDTLISSIDLSAMGSGLSGRKLRMRKLVIEPGGIVPWHSHDKRPSNIYVISGSITEYRSTCSVPIEHGPGDVTAEFGPLSHWWKNNTKHPTVLISADMLSPEMNPDESM